MAMRDHRGRPVVAVTGIGVVISLGVGKADNWKALTAGRSGIHPITRFPVDHLSTRIAGTVDFLPSSAGAAASPSWPRPPRDEAVAMPALGQSGDFAGPLFLASRRSSSTGPTASRSTIPSNRPSAMPMTA